MARRGRGRAGRGAASPYRKRTGTPPADPPRPFMAHLEELRARLIVALTAVVISASVMFVFTGEMLRYLARTAGPFVFLGPTEAIFTRVKLAFAAGLVAALPLVLLQAWKFVAKALAPGARGMIGWAMPVSYLLFVAGCLFGFFAVVPVGVRYLLAMGNEAVRPMMSVGTYVDFTMMVCLAMGVIFQMPLASYFASRAGLLEPALLARNRRVAVLAIYILAALVTPGPDPVTAVLVAVPAYLLYEASIAAARAARGGMR